jgi:hypothetical protein
LGYMKEIPRKLGLGVGISNGEKESELVTR